MLHPVIPVFIASPGDVSKERQLARDAIHDLAPRLARMFGVTLVPVMWEEFAPISSYDASHPQAGILHHIQPFSIFVGILWKRYGTPVGRSRESGTEKEFLYALDNRETISILTYFRNLPKRTKSPKAQREIRQVKALRKRLKEANLWTTSFETTNEFGRRIGGDLLEAAMKLVLSGSPKNVSEYRKVFRFGAHARMPARPLLIVYPPITDSGPGHRAPAENWRRRLLPHVVYEDSKTLQDVEEVMRLLGREYKTVTTESPELETSDAGDRVWVCVPRNEKAKRVLRRLGTKRVRFEFSLDSASAGKSETVLRWQSGNGKALAIKSPLEKYLRYSHRPDGEVEWKPLYGFSYGRDYAVFARFRVPRNFDHPEGREYFYHYFIGGIRGLGTWGIGHLIDHESGSLLSSVERAVGDGVDGDFQILVEVTYENFRIKRVRDVSHENASFFERRSTDAYIREKLDSRKAWLPPEIVPPESEGPSVSRRGRRRGRGARSAS